MEDYSSELFGGETSGNQIYRVRSITFGKKAFIFTTLTASKRQNLPSQNLRSQTFNVLFILVIVLTFFLCKGI